MTARALNICLILLPLSVISAADAAANDPLYGHVTADRILTAAPPGPIYDLIGDLTIDPGVTLTIQPGVTLRVADGTDLVGGGDFPSLTEIDVYGSLQALGSPVDSIHFECVTGGGTWGGLKAEPHAILSLGWVAIADAVRGLRVPGSAGVAVGHTSITSAETAFNLSTASGFDIEDVAIVNCLNGIDASAGSGTVRRCRLNGRGKASGNGLEIGPNVVVAPSDSTAPQPTTVVGFYYGVLMHTGASARNIAAYNNWRGFACYGAGVINYCTAVNNSNDGLGICPGGLLLNSIAAFNDVGISQCGASMGHVDSYASGRTEFWCSPPEGPWIVSVDPGFVDIANLDLRLSMGSPLRTFSNSGGEIGAYGPGPFGATAAHRRSWGQLKARYK